MARIIDNGFSGGEDHVQENSNTEIISADQQGPVQVPSDEFIADADITRDGQDLVLEAPDGSVVVVEGYFNADPAPMIVAPDGSALTPQLVQSFMTQAGHAEYARTDSVIDESPIGEVQEISGGATVTRVDGTTEPLTLGIEIFQGDIIETAEDGAVNIVFIDETSFAVSEDARLAIDEYVFDPATESGSTNFSVLKGLFVFTSGLIGRDDPDDVTIDTPVGSIGIRGTVIVGNVDTGEITVVEGAIVLRGFNGSEVTLDDQFETGKFDPANGEVINMGVTDASQLSENFGSIGQVSPGLFSGFTEQADAGNQNDAGGTGGQANAPENNENNAEQTAAVENNDENNETQQEAVADPNAQNAQPVDGDGNGENADGESDPEQMMDVAGEAGFDDAMGEPGQNNAGNGPGNGSGPNGSTGPAGTQQGAGNNSNGNAQQTADDNTGQQPPPPPQNVDLIINRTTVDDSLVVGDVIAVIETTADFPVVNYTLLNDLGGRLEIVDLGGDVALIRLASGSLTDGEILPIAVKATLPNGISKTKGFAVEVDNLNDAPTVGDNTFGVNENTAASTIVGNVSASDPDAGQTLSYSITGGNVGGAFSIDAAGNIRVNGALDFEGLNSYNLTVEVTDNGAGTLSDTATITINLGDVNEAPVVSNATFAVNETAAGGTSIGFVTASDVDAGQTLTYAITGGNTGGAFSINAATGEITVNGGVLDFESLTTYNLTVEATDDGTGTLSDTATITVNIGDADDESSTLDINTGTTVAEGASIGITTAMLDASDVDTADAGISYNIVTVPANGQLELTTNPGVPITSFTQAHLNGGQVVYVHDGSDTTADSFIFDVGDGTNAPVTGQTFNLTINPVNDLPTLDLDANDSGAAGDDFADNFTEGTPVSVIDGDSSITDSDNPNMNSATVAITNALDGAFEELFISGGDQTISGITITGSGTHTITLTGAASIANYETVLEMIQYQNLRDVPNTTNRVIDVTVNDGVANSNTAQTTLTITPVDDNDTLVAGDFGGDAGDDTINGGAGSDTINGNAGNDTLNGGANADTINGGVGDDTITGGAGADMLNGGAGNDTIIINDDAAADTVDGGAGIDTYDGSAVTGGFIVDTDTGFLAGTVGADTFSNIEIFQGGSGIDTFIDTSGSGYQFLGGGGNDKFQMGNDTSIDIDGGTGTDILEFNNGGTYDFANFSFMDSIEIFQTDGSAQMDITLDLSASLFANDTGDITFNIDDLTAGDTLDIDFGTYTGGGAWNLISGDITGVGFATFQNGVLDQVTINYTGTGANITVTGASTDVTAPSLIGEGTHISLLSGLTVQSTDVHLHFDENVQLGTGNIEIRRVSDDSVVDTINITTNAVVNGPDVEVHLNTSLTGDDDYYVLIDGTAIEDLAGNAFAGITGVGNTAFSFSTGKDTFMTTVGGLNGDGAHAAIKVFDSISGLSEGYVVVGKASRGGNTDITITKMDELGFVDDVQTIGGSGTDIAHDIIQHSGGDFFITGASSSFGATGDDFLITRLDNDGNVQWTKEFALGGAGDNESAAAVVETSSGDIAVAGTQFGAQTSGLIVNVDTTGAFRWDVELSAAGNNFDVADIASANAAKYEGDLFVGGNTDMNGSQDMVITRVNEADGSFDQDATQGPGDWVYSVNTNETVPGDRIDVLNAFIEHSGGSLVLAGSTNHGDSSAEQGLIVKLSTDANGDNPTVDWSVALGGVGNFDAISSITEASDGNILVAGRTGAGNHILVAKINVADGSLNWAKTIEHTTSPAVVESLIETDDGRLLLSGQTNADSAGGTDAFVLKLNSDGSIHNDDGTLITSGTIDGLWSMTNGITHTNITGDTTVTNESGDVTNGLSSGTLSGNLGGSLTVTQGEDVNIALDALSMAASTDTTILGDDTNNTLSDASADGVLAGFAGDDTFNTNGFDIILGGSGNDTIIFDDSGATSTLMELELGLINGDGGNDIFKLESGNDLDLSFMDQFSPLGLKNMERIDLDNAADAAQTVFLSYDAIIGVTDVNNTLIIDGDTSGDAADVDLTGLGFTLDSGGGAQGAGYEYYTDGTVHLYIDDNIDQTNVTI